MASRFLAFPPFEPDKAEYNITASDAMLNVLPAADGHKPQPALVEVSSALPATCLGAVAVRDSSDAVVIFAGTATDLYKLNTATSPYSWTSVSKSAAAYSVPTDEKWVFTKFGTNLVAHTLGDVPQYIDIDTPTAFADLTGAPTARHSWVAGDFLVFGHLSTANNKIRWSGVNDITFWTIGKRGADEQVIPRGGEIMGGIGDQRGAIVISRGAMHYMQFAPASGFTFTIAEANPERGVIAAYGIVQIGPGQFIYLSEDGFFSGVQGAPIGAERVDGWFFDQVDLDFLYDVRGSVDPFEKIVWFKFRLQNGTFKLLGYDWQLDRWCQSDASIREAVALLTPEISWDGLDSLYASIDAVDSPFDSRLFKGGRLVFGAVTTDDKLAYFSGTNRAATLETNGVELIPGERAFVNGGRLVGDPTTFTAQIGTQDFHGDTVTWDTAVSPSSRTKFLPFRGAGRLHRHRVSIAAGATWKIASGIQTEYEREGGS